MVLGQEDAVVHLLLVHPEVGVLHEVLLFLAVVVLRHRPEVEVLVLVGRSLAGLLFRAGVLLYLLSLGGRVGHVSSRHHQFLILELGDFRPELLILRNQFFFPPGVIIDLVALLLDQPRHFLNPLLELAVLGVDINDHLFVGWIGDGLHSVISVSRFSLVMISELSLDWMSLSVISLFLVVLWSMGSFCSRFFTFSILVFICDRVLIILL